MNAATYFGDEFEELIYDIEDRLGEDSCSPYLYKYLLHENQDVRCLAAYNVAYHFVDDARTVEALKRSFKRYQDGETLGALFWFRHKTLNYLLSTVVPNVDKELIIEAVSFYDREDFGVECTEDGEDKSPAQVRREAIYSYNVRYIELNINVFLSIPTKLLSEVELELNGDLLNLAQHAEDSDLENCQALVQRYSRDIWLHLEACGDRGKYLNDYWSLVLLVSRFDQAFLAECLQNNKRLYRWLIEDLPREFTGMYGDPEATDALIKMLETKMYDREYVLAPSTIVELLRVVYPYRHKAILAYEPLLKLCKEGDDNTREEIVTLAVENCIPNVLDLLWELRSSYYVDTVLMVFEPNKRLHMYAEQRVDLIQHLPAFAWRLLEESNDQFPDLGIALELLNELDKRSVISLEEKEMTRIISAINKDFGSWNFRYFHEILSRQHGDLAYARPMLTALLESAEMKKNKVSLESLLELVNKKSLER